MLIVCLTHSEFTSLDDTCLLRVDRYLSLYILRNAHIKRNAIPQCKRTNNKNKIMLTVNGGYTSWTTWTTCTRSCGSGSQARTRSCTNPRPAHGGAQCSGSSSDTQSCNTQSCAGNLTSILM